MDILEHLTETELTHISSGLGVNEVQYRFEGRASPGQKVANSVIDTAIGATMEYMNLMKDNQHKKV